MSARTPTIGSERERDDDDGGGGGGLFDILPSPEAASLSLEASLGRRARPPSRDSAVLSSSSAAHRLPRRASHEAPEAATPGSTSRGTAPSHPLQRAASVAVMGRPASREKAAPSTPPLAPMLPDDAAATNESSSGGGSGGGAPLPAAAGGPSRHQPQQRPTFVSSLPLVLRPQHFARNTLGGEEHQVCHDIIKACGLIELRVGSAGAAQGKARGWSAAANNAHNGPVQAFLAQPLRELSKLETWAAWKAMRDDIMADWIPFALDAFEIHMRHDSAGSAAPTGAVASGGNDDGGAVREIGASRVFLDEALLVHVWNDPRSARSFTSGWRRVWDALLHHRILGIHCPFSVAYVIRGTFVTVTALPPLLLHDRPPIMFPSTPPPAHRGPASPAASDAPPHHRADSMVSYSAALLLEALGIPRQECGGLPFVRGVDGRFYLISLAEVMKYKVERHTAAASLASAGRIPVRHELLVAFAQARAAAGAPPSAGEHAASLYPFITSTTIPQVLAILAKTVRARIGALPPTTVVSAAMRSGGAGASGGGGGAGVGPAISRLAQSTLVRDIFHLHGVNMCHLYAVLVAAQTHPNLPGVELQAVQTLLVTEMVHRVLKTFCRNDILQASSEGRTSAEDHAEVVNRVCHLVITKNAAFWAEHFQPALREKFATPSTFTVAYSQFVLGAVVRHLTTALGAEFSADAGRFIGFSEIGSSTALCPAAPPFVLNMTSARADDVVALVSEAWGVASSFAPGSVGWECWSSRAVVASSMVGVGAQTLLAHIAALDRVLQERRQLAKANDGRGIDSGGGSQEGESDEAGHQVTPTVFATLHIGALAAEQLALTIQLQAEAGKPPLLPDDPIVQHVFEAHRPRLAAYLARLAPDLVPADSAATVAAATATHPVAPTGAAFVDLPVVSLMVLSLFNAQAALLSHCGALAVTQAQPDPPKVLLAAAPPPAAAAAAAASDIMALVHRGLQAFLSAAHADITFSMPHLSAIEGVLRTAGALSAVHTDAAFRTVSAVREHLEKKHGIRTRLKYDMRLLQLVCGTAPLEAHPVTLELTLEVYDAISRELQLDDPRTSRVVLHLAASAAQALLLIYAVDSTLHREPPLGLAGDAERAREAYGALLRQLRHLREVRTGHFNQQATAHADITVAAVAAVRALLTRVRRLQDARSGGGEDFGACASDADGAAVGAASDHYQGRDAQQLQRLWGEAQRVVPVLEKYIRVFGVRHSAVMTIQRIGRAHRARRSLQVRRLNGVGSLLQRVGRGWLKRCMVLWLRRRRAVATMAAARGRAFVTRRAVGGQWHIRRSGALLLLQAVGRGLCSRAALHVTYFEKYLRQQLLEKQLCAEEQRAREIEARLEELLTAQHARHANAEQEAVARRREQQQQHHSTEEVGAATSDKKSEIRAQEEAEKVQQARPCPRAEPDNGDARQKAPEREEDGASPSSPGGADGKGRKGAPASVTDYGTAAAAREADRVKREEQEALALLAQKWSAQDARSRDGCESDSAPTAEDGGDCCSALAFATAFVPPPQLQGVPLPPALTDAGASAVAGASERGATSRARGSGSGSGSGSDEDIRMARAAFGTTLPPPRLPAVAAAAGVGRVAPQLRHLPALVSLITESHSAHRDRSSGGGNSSSAGGIFWAELDARHTLSQEEAAQRAELQRWRLHAQQHLRAVAESSAGHRRSAVAQLSTTVVERQKAQRIREQRRLEAIESGHLELLAEMPTREEEAAEAERTAQLAEQLHRHRAAGKVQCAWRANCARFELRFRRYQRRYERSSAQLRESIASTGQVGGGSEEEDGHSGRRAFGALLETIFFSD